MRVLIDGLSEFYGERVRLVKTLMKREAEEEFPEVLKWALQMLYFHGDGWLEICRIDNYPHENQQGSHIHHYGKEEVRKVRMDFRDAEKAIKNISARILKERFNETVRFEG